MGYDDEKELDSADFGEVLAREVLRCVPRDLIFQLCRTNSGKPELELERLVAACNMALPECIGIAMQQLRWFNSGCVEEGHRIDMDELVDLIHERVASRMFGGDDEDDD